MMVHGVVKVADAGVLRHSVYHQVFLPVPDGFLFIVVKTCRPEYRAGVFFGR